MAFVSGHHLFWWPRPLFLHLHLCIDFYISCNPSCHSSSPLPSFALSILRVYAFEAISGDPRNFLPLWRLRSVSPSVRPSLRDALFQKGIGKHQAEVQRPLSCGMIMLLPLLQAGVRLIKDGLLSEQLLGKL